MTCPRCNGDRWVRVERVIKGARYDYCKPCPECSAPEERDGKMAAAEREETR